MGPAARVIPTIHQRPAEGEAHELLGFERVLFLLRLVGVAVVVVQAPAYQVLSPWIVIAVAALTMAAAVAGRAALHEDLPLARIRRRAGMLLGTDLVAMYVVGTAFTPDPAWLGFYYYPLLSLEATLIAGTAAGLAVTGASIVVYGAQLVLHVALGNPVELREVLGAVSMLAMTGGFMAVFGQLVDRGRRDLRVLLDLAAALQQPRDEAATIDVLDQRLRDAIGGRVRSIALRDDEGRFEVVRWHTQERHALDWAALEHALGRVDGLSAVLAGGASLTCQTDAGSVVTCALALPEWARAVTLVPIISEGRWVGVLPVLWTTGRTPTRHEVRLLYGLAGHVGMALAQGQLQRARAEAANDQLTGLLNRRAIAEELAGYVARAVRAEGSLAVMLCDLDNFKAVNDRLGHEAGDAVLATVATAVRGALRLGDVVGRYGGDELLIVAADADGDSAIALAHRVRAAVRGAAGQDGVDITIGIALLPADGRTDGELMAAADHALYRGRLRGPGQVVVGGGPDQRPDPAGG